MSLGRRLLWCGSFLFLLGVTSHWRVEQTHIVVDLFGRMRRGIIYFKFFQNKHDLEEKSIFRIPELSTRNLGEEEFGSLVSWDDLMIVKVCNLFYITLYYLFSSFIYSLYYLFSFFSAIRWVAIFTISYFNSSC